MTNSIKLIEDYIYQFFDSRMAEIYTFYRSVSNNRHIEIYRLKNGTDIMDHFNSITGNIEENFYGKPLIPDKYSSPKSLFYSLNSFKDYLKNKEYLLTQNINGENTSYIITELLSFQNEIIEMIDYAKELYELEDSPIPYKKLRIHLIQKDIHNFIKTLKSILASVSYAISKSKEGYYHSNIHLILKILGFNIISEELTNIGRIDAVIRFLDTIYILEFKFSKNTDESEIALNQIKENRYFEKFEIEKEKIIGIGISFGEEERNINGFKYEEIKQ